LARADLPAALAHESAFSRLLEPQDRAATRQDAYAARFALADQQGQSAAAKRWLALALAAQNELTASLTPSERDRFLQNVPINRKLAEAVARYTVTQTVTLARGNATIPVVWSIAHPEDELIDEPAARRRHVLTRLLAEAAAHGATPTHDQLAAALGVSRRTILRDLA